MTLEWLSDIPLSGGEAALCAGLFLAGRNPPDPARDADAGRRVCGVLEVLRGLPPPWARQVCPDLLKEQGIEQLPRMIAAGTNEGYAYGICGKLVCRL